MQLETSDYTASVMLNYSLVGALLDAAPATPGARYVRDSSSDVRRAPFGYHAPRWRMSVQSPSHSAGKQLPRSRTRDRSSQPS